MLRLVRVALDHPDAVRLLALLLKVLVHLGGELLAHHGVQRDVDVRRVLTQELISHPSAGDPERHRQLVPLDDVQQGSEDLLLLRGAHDGGAGFHDDDPPLLHVLLLADVAKLGPHRRSVAAARDLSPGCLGLDVADRRVLRRRGGDGRDGARDRVVSAGARENLRVSPVERDEPSARCERRGVPERRRNPRGAPATRDRREPRRPGRARRR
mmetsp:Transcript_6974/g.27421  ORF Transcript_6974/g.27421 Transcript_6974/m.27421 type:complete len:212 (-) Transcript_6974:192-827(-)